MKSEISPKGTSPRKVMVIGLDVGDGKLIREGIDGGHLPIMSSLLEGGTWGWLKTPAEVLHISAWPSLYTGTNPGKHGVYYPFQPCPGRQGACRIGPEFYGQAPIWALLDAAGMRCTVFDAPYTFPVDTFRGIQIFEWGTWAWYWKPMSTPAAIFSELKNKMGRYPVNFEANQIGFSPLDLPDLRKRLLQGIARKAESVQWLKSRGPWDFFIVAFGETHPAAHYFWPDDGGPSDFSYLKDIYSAIDTAIGKIVEDLDDDTTIFIVSGDSAGPNYAGWHLLPSLLTKLGFMASAQAETSENGSQESRTGKKDILKRLRDMVPLSARQALSRRLPARWRDSLMSRWAGSEIDWARTRAFCLPTDLEGCIRINLKGREPNGIVDPGREYDRVCDELVEELQGLVNPRTQVPAISRVVRTDQIFPGKQQSFLPDLVVTWAEKEKIEELYSPRIGTVKGISPDIRSGTHRPPGFVLVHGPCVPKELHLEKAKVVDFAPTVLNLFNIPQAEAMDGRSWLCQSASKH